MSLMKGFTEGIAKANETLATAQKSWRDESLSAREDSVGARELTVREREKEVSKKLAMMADLESKRRFRRVKYWLAGIAGFAIGGPAGLLVGIAGAPGSEVPSVTSAPVQNELQADTATDAASVRAGADTSLEAALAQSNDYDTYGAAFRRASNSLIADGRCEVADFVEIGGWMKSTTTYAAEPVYFTYCGDRASVGGRIYVNAETGDIFT